MSYLFSFFSTENLGEFVMNEMGLYSQAPGGHFKIHIPKVQRPLFIYRYKTTVSSARENIVRTETDMARFDWLLFTYKYWRVNQTWL